MEKKIETDPNDPINIHDGKGDGKGFKQGLTKREYFAAMALQGLLSNERFDQVERADHLKRSVVFADNLIKELNK